MLGTEAAGVAFRRLMRSQYVIAYFAQLVSFVTISAFNFILPLQVGARLYGEFVAVFSIAFTAFALFVPGYTLAVVREVSAADLSGRHNRFVFTLLMVPMCGVALVAAVLVGPWLLSLTPEAEMSVLVAVLTLELSAAHLLDCLLSSQERNHQSLLARVVWGVGVCTLPWALTATFSRASAAVGGVTIAYALSLVAYSRALARSGEHVSRGHDIRGLLKASVHYSAVSFSNTLFTWATLLAVSASVAPAELGALKLALALPTAGVALLPFPQLLIFSRLQRTAGRETSGGASARRLLASSGAVGALFAAGLYIVAPHAITALYGPDFAPAASYVAVTSWILIPQALEQPLLAVLSTGTAPPTLARAYVGGFILGLAIPLFANAVVGPPAIAAGILAGRTIAVAMPAALLLRARDHRSDDRGR